MSICPYDARRGFSELTLTEPMSATCVDSTLSGFVMLLTRAGCTHSHLLWSGQFSQPRLKGFRFAQSIISYAVWAFHRFALSLGDVEDLLAKRGVIVSYESIRVWCQRFGTQIAAKIRRNRSVPAEKWCLEKAVISI